MKEGTSFSGALQIVAKRAPEPVGSEFRIVVEEASLGFELGDALARMVIRVESRDLKSFVTAVALQRSAGGSLTEVLENTSRLVSNRAGISSAMGVFAVWGRVQKAGNTRRPPGVVQSASNGRTET